MNPFIIKVMRPPTWGYSGQSRRQFSDLAFRGSGKKSRFSSGDDGFDETFDETRPSSWSTWTPPRPTDADPNGSPRALHRRRSRTPTLAVLTAPSPPRLRHEPRSVE